MSVMQCRSVISEIREKYKTIVLQGIPPNCGIPGNEKMDELAKTGCSVNQGVCTLINYKSISSMVNEILKTTYASQLKKRTK